MTRKAISVKFKNQVTNVKTQKSIFSSQPSRFRSLWRTVKVFLIFSAMAYLGYYALKKMPYWQVRTVCFFSVIWLKGASRSPILRTIMTNNGKIVRSKSAWSARKCLQMSWWSVKRFGCCDNNLFNFHQVVWLVYEPPTTKNGDIFRQLLLHLAKF